MKSLKSGYTTVQFRLYLIVFFVVLAFSITQLVVPLYAFKVGASQLEIGLIGLVYFAASVPLSPLFGRLSDKVGRSHILVVSILGNAVTTILLIVAENVLGLVVLRAIQGILASAFWPITEACVADVAPPSKMGEAMSLFSISYGLSFMIGPTAGGFFLDNYSFDTAFLASFVLLIISIPAILIKRKTRSDCSNTDCKDESISTVHKLFETTEYEKRILFPCCLAVWLYGIIAGVVTAIFPVFAKVIGLTATQIGFLLMGYGFARIVAFWGAGKLGDRFDKKMLNIIGVGVCSSIMFVAVLRAFDHLFVVMALIGIGLGVIYPSSLALISAVSSTRRGLLIGFFDSSLSLGMAMGSQLGGALAEYGGLETPYYFCSAANIIGVMILTLQLRKSNNARRISSS